MRTKAFIALVLTDAMRHVGSVAQDLPSVLDRFFASQDFFWMTGWVHVISTQELAYIELFAGAANVFRTIRPHYPAMAVDLEYWKDGPPNNPFDMCSTAGFAHLSFF